MRRIILTVGLAIAFGPLPILAQGWPSPAADPAASEARQAAPRPIPPQAFHTPEEGFAALADAVRKHDERRLLRVLGGEARRLVRSGDPVADRASRERFAAAHAERAEILYMTPYYTVLEVGNDRWPFPIPMVRPAGHAGKWHFDTRQGVQELVDRRKLDRLSHNAAFLLSMRDAGVRFVAADMPDANELTIGIMAVVAEGERRMISDHTKAALAAAKARGVKLGNPNAFGGQVYREVGKAAVVRADDFAQRLASTVREMQARGLSLHAMARELDTMGVRTARGGAWTATAVRNVIQRIGA